MASEDETLSSLGSLGLGRILASAGIDPSSIGSFLGDAGQSSKELTQVELDEDDAKFEDDISDDELPEEGEEERRQREIDQEARKREQERWMRKGLEMMKKSMEQQQTKDKKGKQKADDGKTQEQRDLEEARKIWPDFDKGKRLRMSEIFYETPADVRAFEAKRKKRRTEMVKETKTCKTYMIMLKSSSFILDKCPVTFTVAPPPIPSLQSTFLLPTLQPIRLPQRRTPTYNKPIGAFFDKKWIREAKDRRRLEMTKPPEGLDLEDVKKVRYADETKDLDLVDWEQSIIMNSL